MLTLAVDTSTRAGSLAILRDRSVLRSVATCPSEPHASALFAELDRLLAELGLQTRDFDLFAAAGGPGSFTGLRVGLTAVKAFAEAFARPVTAVSTMEAIAVQAVTPAAPSGVIFGPTLDARRGQVFGGIYEFRESSSEDLLRIGEEVVMGADEFVQMVSERAAGRPVVFVSPTVGAIVPAVERAVLRSARLAEVSGVLAPFVGKLAYARALRGEVGDALRLDANYVRRSDAEMKWRE
jgi:tRNA threonylcarbamoyladenosine biosynthesis protein TsaB